MPCTGRWPLPPLCVRRQAVALGAAWPKNAATGVAVPRGTWPRGVFRAMGRRQSLPWTVLIRRPGGMHVLLCHEDGGAVETIGVAASILAGDFTKWEPAR
ncbi:hypothetical protein ZWY2020_047710 [Hordeum vulgare]|nr:hypothetical protein ZWY2020_047710 [Hordeum vulgare]